MGNMQHIIVINVGILALFNTVNADFYAGMFARNDYLVADDFVHRDRVPNERTFAKYGRVFDCPITYIRVEDRVVMPGGPITQVVRGGLLDNFVVLMITSAVDSPVSARVQVGCHNPNTKAAVDRRGFFEDADYAEGREYALLDDLES